MGAPFGKSVVQWSNGRYEGATTGQHDYGVMENQGAPRKLDDYTGDPQTAIQMRPDCESGLLIVSGIIEKKPDTDAFRFESTGGTVTIAGVPAAVGPNVDVELELYDSDSVLIATASPAGDLSAGLSQSLTAGEYTVVIDGTYDVLYSDYGSIGQYTLSITGAVVVPPVCTGDLNCDGAVNITDLGTLLANFGMTTGATLADGDVSGDGAVDITDLGALLAGFGLSC
jgi:hypothetical protein